MPGLSAGPIFISYSRKDRDVMWQIVRFLREQGIKVWVDDEKLIPGTPIWEEEIEKAIRAASAAIVVMSPDSKTSEWVRREISLADQNRKQIFPVLVSGDEDSSVTLRLITRQYVDMRENEKAGLNSLYAALSSYLDELQPQVSEDFSFEKVTTDQSSRKNHPNLEIEKKLINGATPWITAGWALSGAIGGFMYDGFGAAVGGAIAGALSGLITAITLQSENPSIRKSMLWIVLAWTFAGALGWYIGEELTEAIGMGIGYAIIAAIGMSITMRLQRISVNWKSLAWIILSWAIGGMIGWLIGRYIQQNEILESSTGWAIGYAASWAIAGFVTMWQMRKME